MKRLILILGALTLVSIAGVFGVVALQPTPEPRLERPLAELLPSAVPGWTVTDVPLAETEEGLARVDELLSFNDHVARVYKRGDTELMVYVAYWHPGAVPVKQVHEHTPDICWVGNGWERQATEHTVPVPALPTGLPAEFRSYTKRNQPTDVVFWHVVGDTTYHNPLVGKALTSFNFLRTLEQYGLNQRREQLFVRISSGKDPRAVLAEHPSLAPVREALGGVFPK
ncbi:MAG: exosortase-associated EpsI family protein [Opitutales bacterium]